MVPSLVGLNVQSVDERIETTGVSVSRDWRLAIEQTWTQQEAEDRLYLGSASVHVQLICNSVRGSPSQAHLIHPWLDTSHRSSQSSGCVAPMCFATLLLKIMDRSLGIFE